MKVFIVCFFIIFREFSSHFLGSIFLHITFIASWCWLFLSFAKCNVTILVVATCASMIISNSVRCLLFQIFQGTPSSFLGFFFYHFSILVASQCWLSLFFFDWHIVDALGVATFTLVIIIGNVYCWLLGNFLHIPSFFWFYFVSPFYFGCVIMQAFSFSLIGVNY